MPGNQIVVVTGAARGLGALFCQEFLRRGYHVLAVDRCPVPWSEVREPVSLGRLHCLEIDVTDSRALQQIRERLSVLNGTVCGLVNNAATMHGGEFEQVEWAHHEAMARVNMETPLKLTHFFLAELIKARSAFIVNVCSVTSFAGVPYGVTYAATKWAMLGFSESLRNELRIRGHRHVHVMALCPGTVSTGLFEGTRPPRLMPMLRPNDVVAAAMKGLDRKQEVVMMPTFVRFIPMLRGVLPPRVFEFFSRLLGVHDALRTWRGRGR